MRLHHGRAVLHCVMFAVVFCCFVLFFFWEGGGGGEAWSMILTAGLRSAFITKCSRAKICFIQTLYFYRVSKYMHYEYKILNSSFDTIVCLV